MNAPSTVEFDEASHTYRYNGRLIPGVTAVLEQLQHLEGIPWAVLEAARKFGTHVHLACHLWNLGELDEESLDPNLAPYLAGYKKFLAETGFVVLASEERVFNKATGYAGTLDLRGTWKASTWVADIKSGIVPSTIGAQLAAYQEAAPERPRQRLCVQLAPNDYKLHECKERGDFSLFVSALNCYRHVQKHAPRKHDHGNESSRFEDSAA